MGLGVWSRDQESAQGLWGWSHFLNNEGSGGRPRGQQSSIVG